MGIPERFERRVRLLARAVETGGAVMQPGGGGGVEDQRAVGFGSLRKQVVGPRDMEGVGAERIPPRRMLADRLRPVVFPGSGKGFVGEVRHDAVDSQRQQKILQRLHLGRAVAVAAPAARLAEHLRASALRGDARGLLDGK